MAAFALLASSAVLPSLAHASDIVAPAAGGHDDYFNSDSCATSTFCMAVGGSFVNGHWHGQSASPSATTTSGLDDVACPTTRFCMAVGFAGGSRTYQATAFTTRDGTAWRKLAVPRPRRARNSELGGLACFNSANCMAVGNYTSASGHNLPYAARWHDSRWELLTAPAFARQRFTIFQGISCPTATSCLAVGNTEDNTRQEFYHAFAEIWSGGEWRGSTLRRVPSYFTGVSCPARNRCFASGATFRRSLTAVGQGLVETWNGRTWTTQHPIRTAAPRYGDRLQQVSCVTRSRCVAVGWRFNPRVKNSDQTLAEMWNGHRWIVQATANP